MAWNGLKQLPFYFYVHFWGISPSRRTLECHAGRNVPQFYLFPRSHGSISFLQNGKEARKFFLKSCLHKRRFQYSSILLRFGNALGSLMYLGSPPTGEHTRMGTSTKIYNLKFYIIICQLPLCSLVLRGSPPSRPSPRFPDPPLHFLLARGVSRVHLAVTRFSSSPLRVYYKIADILCGCFFWEEKRRDRKEKKKKKSRKHYSTACPY